MASKQPGRSGNKRSRSKRPMRSGGEPPVVPLDAEDIAMARLQAKLRKAEAIPVPDRDARLSRTILRLPGEMLKRLRERARRERTSISAIVRASLERYLRSS